MRIISAASSGKDTGIEARHRAATDAPGDQAPSVCWSRWRCWPLHGQQRARRPGCRRAPRPGLDPGHVPLRGGRGRCRAGARAEAGRGRSGGQGSGPPSTGSVTVRIWLRGAARSGCRGGSIPGHRPRWFPKSWPHVKSW